MNLDTENGWLIPAGAPAWLTWGFGTRHAIRRNEASFVKQVHGAEVLVVEASGLAGDADGLITNRPGLSLAIKTADCLPILMADLDHRVVAAIHAGWRGTADRIAQAAVSKMKQIFETKPTDLLVALGPCIGKCCFEVGPEVARQFSAYDPVLGHAKSKCHLDLRFINGMQLEQLGVLPSRILYSELCTYCNGKDFWSYRREGETAGRMWSVAEITG